MSHPVWVRGLKYAHPAIAPREAVVAPRVGAWIEIGVLCRPILPITVAPRVGAWIEILKAYF